MLILRLPKSTQLLKARPEQGCRLTPSTATECTLQSAKLKIPAS